MPNTRPVKQIIVEFADGSVQHFKDLDEDAYYREGKTHESVRDGAGKTRKDRQQWKTHELHWNSDKGPIPKGDPL